MADFAPAIEKTIHAEGGYSFVPATGECVNHGVTLWFLRDVGWVGCLPPETLRSIPPTQDELLIVQGLSIVAAKGIYWTYYWQPQHCGEIHDQALAEKFFDLSVNMGPGQAAKLLQHAVNVAGWPGMHLAEDGAVGPKTIAAVNACDAVDLLRQLKAEAEAFYRNLAAAKPVLAGNLAGWLARVNS